MKKHRIGIVGTGGIARAHIEGYRSEAGELCEVVAGCDPDPDHLAGFCSRYGVPLRFANARELIESGEVDVISVLTPPDVRGEVIFPAAERGIHLLVEKPFAENLADAIAFVEAAERGNATLAVNQSLRFMPDILAIRAVLAAGEIGEIKFIAHDHYQNRARTTGWRKDEERLEISIFSIHVLDRIRWLCDRPPVAVSAVTRHWDDQVRGETFTTLNIQFEGGTVGTMVSNWHSLRVPECRLRIDGTTGSLLSQKRGIATDEATLTIHHVDGTLKRRKTSQHRAAVMGMGKSMKELLAAIAEARAPHHSGRDNLQTMAIVDAAYLSAARGGALVRIDDVWPASPRQAKVSVPRQQQ